MDSKSQRRGLGLQRGIQYPPGHCPRQRAQQETLELPGELRGQEVVIYDGLLGLWGQESARPEGDQVGGLPPRGRRDICGQAHSFRGRSPGVLRPAGLSQGPDRPLHLQHATTQH